MSTEPNPEDEKYLESLKNILKISQEYEKSRKDDKPPESEEVKTEESEKEVEIPPEQQIEPAERVEPLKSMVEPEYVKKVIRQMDTMSTEQLKQALAKIKVSTSGNKKSLRKRVAQYYRKENALLNRKLEPNSDKTARYFDYLIATDFECTCVEVIYDYPHEIIEMPAVLIDVREMKIVSEFRTYVRPVRNPVLSDFCVEFTKIAQETVDDAPFFREAFNNLLEWMRKFGLGEKNTRFAFVTDGPHDMWKFMQFQCLLSNIQMPHMFRSFINIKKTFKEKFNGLPKGNGKSGIENMLERLDLSFVGNKHSGLDDARNIAAITIQMMKLKIELRINQKCSKAVGSSSSQKDNQLELEGEVDLQSMDISRRDFELWMRRLPLKLSSVTRKEFLSEEYLDCESCDDLTDDKNDPESFAQKMAIREMLEKEQAEEFEQFMNENGHSNIGENMENPEPEPEEAETDEDIDDESEEDDYIPDFESQDSSEDANPSSPKTQTEVELNSVWVRPGSDVEREDLSVTHNLDDYEYSTSQYSTPPISARTTSSTFVLVDAESTENLHGMTPPPKNSLASTNRQHNQNF